MNRSPLLTESTRPSLVSGELWVLAAIIAYGVAGYYGPSDPPGLHLATVVALVGLLATTGSLVTIAYEGAFGWLAGALVAGTFLMLRVAEPFVSPGLPAEAEALMTVWFPVVLIVGASGSMLLMRIRHRVPAAILLVMTLMVCGALVIGASEKPLVDVLLAHEAAADAIASGGSPYDPEVVMRDTSPYAPAGHAIVGYPYPPLTAFTYVLGEWAFGDARWLSLLLFAATLALLTLGWGPNTIATKPASILLATLPGWPIVLFLGFTEPLTIFLLCGCLVLWDEKPGIAAVLGGLAIASKQYMLVIAPLLLIAAYRRQPRQALVMTVAGVATVAPIAAMDWADMIRSTVINIAELPIRPDGSSIQGLLVNLGSGISIPLWVSLGVPLCVSFLLALTARSGRQVALGVCITLTSFFLLGSQAFINYWFLVASVVVFAYGLPDQGRTPTARPYSTRPPETG